MLNVLTYLLIPVVTVFCDEPIVDLQCRCPPTERSNPSLHLIADVPAYAVARCRNEDKVFTSTDEVNFSLEGSFDQFYIGRLCQFYKKDGSNTYTVDVEVGWGEKDAHVIQRHKIHTVTCAYDDHGRAISSTETITDWFLNPLELQHLLGDNSTATFRLKVIDVLDREITADNIPIGRKIRLLGEDPSGRAVAFRALTCFAINKEACYFLLRAGCGDGLVFPKHAGFETVGNQVFSPYFEAFRLSCGLDNVQFQCTFTECNGRCDGDSCSVVVRNPPTASPPPPHPERRARSSTIRTVH